jgi:adhesin/invasin
MSDDEHWLYGANAFYDHEFPYGHRRSSVGLEARSSVIELNANKYYGLSDFKSGVDGDNEKVLGGYDVEAGLIIPYMPGGKIYHKQFQWDGENGEVDLKGNTTSLKFSGDLLVPGLSLEVGMINYKNKMDKDFVQLTYTYIPGKKEVRPILSSKPYKFTSMKNHRFEKVRRENRMAIQNGARGTISFR